MSSEERQINNKMIINIENNNNKVSTIMQLS